MVVLPTPGLAGNYQNLGSQRQRDRLSLTFGECQGDPPLDPGNGLVRFNQTPRKLALGKRQKPFGDCPLGAVQTGQKNAGNFPNTVGARRTQSRSRHFW
jgi:hypothetical protein